MIHLAHIASLDILRQASSAASDRATCGSGEVLETPAAKRPKLAVDIAKGLEITPPPIVGQQTVASFLQ